MTKIPVKGIQARINRGVKWLDKNVGRRKWAKKIDLEQLDLSSGSTCMIGEVLGHFGKLAEVDQKAFANAESYGFRNGSEDYKILTHMWFCTLAKLGIGVRK